MVCEGLFRLFGTSSEEIIERTKKEDAEFYQPKIDALSSANNALHSKINYLQNLLKQHDISYNSET